MRLGIIFNAVKRALLPCCLILVVCGGLILGWSDAASASTEAGAVVKERAEREFDSKAGAGSSNQIEGKFQEQAGRAQRQFGDDVEGAAREARGKIQKNVGRAQEASEDAAEDANGLVDRVKDFFD